jgi:hypothetical protein
MKDELMNEWMSHEFRIFLKSRVWNVFSMHKMYEIWVKKFYTISITKSWIVKFVMYDYFNNIVEKS